MPEHSTHIGPYQLSHRINTSEDRSVFFAPRAIGTRIPFDAAVYCLHHTHRQSENGFALQDDFQLLKNLHHPAFPQAIQLYERQFGYAREWIRGASLREMLVMIHQSKTLLPQDTIYDILSEILLGYAHLQQQTPSLMHGRLNWDHVLLGVDGRVTVIGLRTHSNTNLFSFSSPEQATGTFFDWRSDQWSIGAIFASLLLKESLYTGRPNPEYAASRGDVTHWLDRIKVAYPSAYRVVAKMLHPAAGERYGHYSYILRDVERLREIYPNTKRVELGEALDEWLHESPQKHTHSLDLIVPNRVLPQSEPKLQQHILEVTEQIEPEIESYIEVTQFNTPKFQRDAHATQVEPMPEPVHTSPSQNVAEPILPIEMETDSEITEVSEEVPTAEFAPDPLNQPPSNSPLPTENLDNGTSIDQFDTAETSLSEHSLQPYSLAEVSLVGEVFNAQQRAVVLMVVNAILLAIFIYTVLF